MWAKRVKVVNIGDLLPLPGSSLVFTTEYTESTERKEKEQFAGLAVRLNLFKG